MKSITTLAWAGFACLAFAGLAFGGAPPTFTGNVPADFTGSEVVSFPDPGGTGDVGVPASCAANGGTGWDMAGISLFYDRLNDRMHIGIDFASIAGDADNDGDPGSTDPCLLSQGGIDSADLAGTESINVMFDTNLDGLRDVIVGVSGFDIVAGFKIAVYVEPNIPPFAYGPVLPNPVALFASPSAAAPDWEFTIDDFSTLPGLGAPDPVNGTVKFAISAFAGSFQDDGFGEDIITPHLITLICEGFDDLANGEPVAAQFASNGFLVSGASDSGFAGVFTGQSGDHPDVNDNIPVNGPNFLKTREFAADLSSDAGQIFFDFVSPLDGVTPLGATIASLWFLDVETSGNGAPNGSFFNVSDSGGNPICSLPVPWDGFTDGAQVFMECSDPSGSISKVHADVGFPNGFDSGAVDFLCANLNPLALPLAQFTGDGFTVAQDGRAELRGIRNNRRGYLQVRLYAQAVEGGTSSTLIDKTGPRALLLGSTGGSEREWIKSINMANRVPPGDYDLVLQVWVQGQDASTSGAVSTSILGNVRVTQQ
jgi:hypothetical protein